MCSDLVSQSCFDERRHSCMNKWVILERAVFLPDEQCNASYPILSHPHLINSL